MSETAKEYHARYTDEPWVFGCLNPECVTTDGAKTTAPGTVTRRDFAGGQDYGYSGMACPTCGSRGFHSYMAPLRRAEVYDFKAAAAGEVKVNVSQEMARIYHEDF